MKSNIILSLTICLSLTFGCVESNGQKQQSKETTNLETGNDGNQNAKDGNIASIAQLHKSGMADIEKTKFHEVRDPKNGLVQFRSPFPASWKINGSDNPIYIEGPNGLKVYKAETNTYSWSNDPYMQQTIQMGGQNLGKPIGIQQILNQVVKPNAQSQGYKFMKSAQMPEIAGLYQRFFNSMPNTGSQRSVEALATEWESPKGTKSYIVIIRTQIMKQGIVTWTVQTSEMEVSPSYFEKAKQAYAYSIANTQLNPQWIQHMNGEMVQNIRNNDQYWAQVSQQSAAAHAQRMQAIAAAGNASRSLAQTYSEISDISHKGYLDRSHINDAGHSKLIRSINETTVIGNHETGEHYNVPSGSNYYWVSNQGVYIGTDNSLFDPNVDNRTNDDNWTKFAQEQ